MTANFVSQLARRYRRRFPDLKFKVRRGRCEGAFATTHCVEGVYVITLEKGQDSALAAFFLAHELAHALSWNMDEEEHGEHFWQAYRKTYSIYEAFSNH